MTDLPLFELTGPDGHKWELYENGVLKGFPDGTIVINRALLRIYSLLDYETKYKHLLKLLGEIVNEQGLVALNTGLAVSADEFLAICDATIRLTEIRQRGCSHLSVENVAPIIMRNLLTELTRHKAG